MTKHHRWPWSRHLPAPPSEAKLADAEERLRQAKAGLVVDSTNEVRAKAQAVRASWFSTGLGGIMKDNHIGPSVESNFRGKLK